MKLMVVIIILGLLSMFLLPYLLAKSDEEKVQLTCIQIKSISNTLKHYQLRHSTYPSTSEGLNLLKDKNYFEDGVLPKDSWGNEYLYTGDRMGFKIISRGGDTKENTVDDIFYESITLSKIIKVGKNRTTVDFYPITCLDNN